MPLSEARDDSVSLTGLDLDVDAQRMWRWLIAENPLIGDTADAVVGFLYRANPGWVFGDKIDIVESGVEPNVTRLIRRRGGDERI